MSVRKPRRSNDPASRAMRSATAYARLAAKAYGLGNSAAFALYTDKANGLRDRADRMRKQGR